MKKTLFLLLALLAAPMVHAAGDMTADIQSGELWKMPTQQLKNSYFVGENYNASDKTTLRFLTAGHISVGELRPNEMVLNLAGEGENLESLQIVVYNKGDDGAVDKKEFDAKVKETIAALDALTGVKGAKKPISDRETGVKVNAWVWEWDSGIAMLESCASGKKKDFEAEFIRLAMAGNAEALKRGGARDSASRSALKKNVQHDENGDVWIDGIPMIDQGQKGYCVPATCARVFSYYGMDGVDQHAMAALCDTNAGGGTTAPAMEAALTTISRKFHVKMTKLEEIKKSNFDKFLAAYNKTAVKMGKPTIVYTGGESDKLTFDPDVLNKCSGIKSGDINKWLKPVKKSVDEGVPVMWIIPGHMRMIIGYNEKENTIIYSDSWGAAFAKRSMPVAEAIMRSEYRYILKPSK